MATTVNNGKVSFAKANPKAPVQAAPKMTAPAPAPSPAPAAKGGFFAPVGGSNIPTLEAGVHHAVLVGLFDIGTQTSNYLGKETTKRKCVIVWELVGQRIQGTDPNTGEAYDRPRTISQRYTLSMGDKARLRRDVEAVRGKRLTKEEVAQFDLTALLGMNAQLQTTNEEKDGKTYTNIQSVMALMKGQPAVEPETTPAWFHFSTVAEGAVMDASVFPESMAEWTRKLAMSSPEWAQLGGQPPVDAEQQAYGG